MSYHHIMTFRLMFIIENPIQQYHLTHTYIVYQMYIHEQVTNLIMKSYQFHQKIGQGTSARVYKAYDNKTNLSYAIKVIPKAYLNSNPKLYHLILKSCNNDNIVKCYDVFQTAHSILIVTELCNGCDMQKYLKAYLPLAEDHAVMYLKQILNGFKGLHNVGVMHRDFKLANLLVHDDVCKIADLGFAKKMGHESITYTMLGTCITMAPEVLEGNGYGFGADVWSLGVVLYQMLYGRYPYEGFTTLALLKNIKTKPLNFTGRSISCQAQQFIKRCLTYGEKQRISWQQLYTHPLLDKSTFQILYSARNLSISIQENQQFYRKNCVGQYAMVQDGEGQKENGMEGSIMLLRHSNRKKLIIQEIHDIIRKKSQTNSGEEDMEKLKETNKKIYQLDLQAQKQVLLFKYAKEYINYFNRLACCVKFMRLELIEHRKEEINKYLTNCDGNKNTNIEGEQVGKYQAINHGANIKIVKSPPTHPQIQSLLYLVHRKCMYQLLQYKKILNSQINIFKIPKYWLQFVTSPAYKQLQSTIQASIVKIEKIMRGLQHQACLSHSQQISLAACQQKYQHKSILTLYNKYLPQAYRQLFQFYKQQQDKKSQEQEDQKLYQWMEGILYNMIVDERSKLTPEQFDEKMGSEWGAMGERLRRDVIERFQIFYDYM